MKREEASEIVAMIAAAWPTPAMEPPTARLYVERIVELDREQARSFVLGLIDSDEQQRPTIGRIRRGVLERQLPPGCQMGWEEAWSFVQRWFSRVGRNGTLPDHPALAVRVVMLMGWRHMCDSDRPDVIRAQFRDAYQAQQEKLTAEIASLGRALTADEIIDRKQIDEESRGSFDLDDFRLERLLAKQPAAKPEKRLGFVPSSAKGESK